VSSVGLISKGPAATGPTTEGQSGQLLPAGNEFTASFDNAAIGMALVALDSRRLRVNKAFCRMLGYTQPEMLARTVHHITHPDDLAEDLRQRGRCLAGEQEGYQREKRFLHKNGQVVWGYLTCTLARDGSGRAAHFVTQVQDITERKLAEQALRRSEERFRSLTVLSSDWYWEQDDQFRFTAFSGTRQPGPWGADQPALIGRRRWDVSGAWPLNSTWEAHRAVLHAHQPFFDFQYLRSVDGEPTRYVSCSGEPVFDEDGRFSGYRGTARDISAEKLAEQRLRDTQAMLHMAAQVGRLGAWTWDLGEERLQWSHEVCAIHDLKAGFAPTAAESLAFYAPEYRRKIGAATGACMRDGTPYDVEALIVTAKGRRRWVRVIAEAEWDAHGKVRRLQGACQDISDSKRAAEDARLLAAQLTTTLESLTDAFFTVDRDWRFTYVNGEAERLLRRARSDLLGRELWKEVPDLQHSACSGHCRRAMAEEVTVQFEHQYSHLDLWLHVKAYPSEQGLAIVMRDVSEQRAAQSEILRLNAELEERVRQRTAQLEAANKELEAFSYSLAHDLRAPLSSIDGFSLVLEQTAGSGLSERNRHHLDRIRAGVRQMAELTDGLLSLANLSRATLRSEKVDLAELARASVAACRERAPERAVEVEIAPALPVTGDPRLLAQVIGNLVGNAWKFTALTEHARIEVGSTSDVEGNVVIFVRDNGAGFDMAYASRMFEAFQRLHSSAEFDGTGIGLAIVHRVIARHGGRVWADAAPQRGASFYFTLGQAPG
jgi:PAS domain S-box-containing protein